jgi:hypothetical protein
MHTLSLLSPPCPIEPEKCKIQQCQLSTDLMGHCSCVNEFPVTLSPCVRRPMARCGCPHSSISARGLFFPLTLFNPSPSGLIDRMLCFTDSKMSGVSLAMVKPHAARRAKRKLLFFWQNTGNTAHGGIQDQKQRVHRRGTKV